jgi:hypothetical protein
VRRKEGAKQRGVERKLKKKIWKGAGRRRREGREA